MTFVDAAIEILRRHGAALHAKQIAAKAIEADLLTHVGKTPEQTMAKRLSEAVAKHHPALVRVRPGVYGLREGAIPPPVVAPPKPAVKQPQSAEGTSESAASAPKPAKRSDGKTEGTAQAETDVAAKTGRGDAAAASSEEKANGAGSTSGEEGRSSRKRRRKSRRSEGRKDDRGRKEEHAAAPDHETGGAALEVSQVRAAAAELLRRHGGPLPAQALAAKLALPESVSPPVLDALLRIPQQGLPLFVLRKGGWTVLERGVSQDVAAALHQLQKAGAACEEGAVKALHKRLRHASLSQLTALLLRWIAVRGEAVSIAASISDQVVARVSPPTSASAPARAVLIRKDSGKALHADAVAAFRGSLHRYDVAFGEMVFVGDVGGDARKEATAKAVPPVRVLDGREFAAQLVAAGVGVRRVALSVPLVEEDAFA